MAEFRSHCMIVPNTQCEVGITKCFTIHWSKGFGGDIVPFHYCDIVLYFFDLFTGFEKVLICYFMGNFSSGGIWTASIVALIMSNFS